jgi:CheY-like chemotaxis protein
MAVSVLVVDDDAGFRSLAVGMLRAEGHDRVYEAATVAEALRQAARAAPEAALVDIGLPDGDGVALARALAAPPRATRVVLISADADASDDLTAASVGAVGFVAKEEQDTWLRELLGRP